MAIHHETRSFLLFVLFIVAYFLDDYCLIYTLRWAKNSGCFVLDFSGNFQRSNKALLFVRKKLRQTSWKVFVSFSFAIHRSLLLLFEIKC